MVMVKDRMLVGKCKKKKKPKRKIFDSKIPHKQKRSQKISNDVSFVYVVLFWIILIKAGGNRKNEARRTEKEKVFFKNKST